MEMRWVSNRWWGYHCQVVSLLLTLLVSSSPGAAGQFLDLANDPHAREFLRSDNDDPILSDPSAGTLIREAHRFDNMYAPQDQSDRDQALAVYRQALASGPGDAARFHVLFRMAQLQGVNFIRSRGERPNYAAAIGLYEQIISEFPPQEPLVLKAMLSIGDHYTTMWRFSDALQWYKQVLVSGVAGQMLEEDGLLAGASREAEGGLAKTASEIQQFQELAVDQIASVTLAIDPSLFHVELERIRRAHPNNERLVRRVAEHLDSATARVAKITAWSLNEEELLNPYYGSRSAPTVGSATTSIATAVVAAPVASATRRDTSLPIEAPKVVPDYRSVVPFVFTTLIFGIGVTALFTIFHFRRKEQR